MKSCPHCKIQVGGDGEYCPLCQNPLVGQSETPRYPVVEPAQRRASLLYKIIAFFLLAGTIVCAALDFMLTEGPHWHWSIMVLVPVVGVLLLLRVFVKRRYNAPKLLFQLLVGISLVMLFCDWYAGWGLYDLIGPVLCIATLVLNFVFAFVNKSFTENGLIYLLLNIAVGIVPYIALLLLNRVRSVLWVICLLVSVITFLGLVIFKGRTLWSEFEKRLHM